jgi:integrase
VTPIATAEAMRASLPDDRGEDTERIDLRHVVDQTGRLRLVGRPGDDMHVVAVASTGQADIQGLQPRLQRGDDVGRVDRAALSGVHGAGVAEGQVGRDVRRRQHEGLSRPRTVRRGDLQAAGIHAGLNDARQDPEWGMQLWLTMVSGCRRGELCALRWRNIDFERSNLWLEKATIQSRSGIMEKDPKNGEGRRVSLDPHTLELLRKHRVDVTEQLFALGARLTDDAYVFSQAPDYSEPWKPKSVTQRYRKMAMRLRLRSTRLHALRHYSTGLLAAGVDLRTVAGRLGHGDGITTLRTYGDSVRGQAMAVRFGAAEQKSLVKTDLVSVASPGS